MEPCRNLNAISKILEEFESNVEKFVEISVSKRGGWLVE